MHNNYVHYATPQFRLLSDCQLEELHLATLHILERTGVAFKYQEAINILGDSGADVSNPDRVKIPSCLVEQALRTAPRTITLYTREGEPAMVLNGTRSHFGPCFGHAEHLDPYSGKRRPTYIEDIADITRVVDALPNLEFQWSGSFNTTVPGSIADKISALQVLMNSSKPVGCILNDAESVREILKICSIIAGSEAQFRKKPFIWGSQEPFSPLVQVKEALEKSLLFAEKGIPNIVVGCQMAGATTPATWAAELVIANAEVLSHLVVIQLKYPGAPVIYGNMPSIMDMRTGIYSFGAPELALNVAASTELSHYYGLPMNGTAGCTDSDSINAQTAAEVTYQILLAALTGADLVDDIGMMYHSTTQSPELMVFCNEIIDMVKVVMGGIEINEEALPLDLIERIGPRGTYITEKHTLKHFRKFWAPELFDRSGVRGKDFRNCEDLVRERTIRILETHQPKPLPDDIVKELRKREAGWLKRAGLAEYPKRPPHG